MIRYLRAAGAATVLLVLLAAVPAGLALMFGNPSQGWADVYAGDVSDTALLDVLATIAWLAWAQFAASVVREILAQVRRTPRPRITGLLPGQRLARTLVTAVFLVGPTAAPVFAAPPASAVAAAPAVSALPVPVNSPAPQHSSPAQATQGTRPLVIGADGPFTFWDLASRYLGAGERWREIWTLNQGRTQPDGTVMSEPHWLVSGWTILIPDTGLPAPGLGDPLAGGTRAAHAGGHDGAAWSSPSATTMFGLGAGAGLLAGVTLAELVECRHRQSRYRRPGRVPASTPPELAATERNLVRHGPAGRERATALDHALRLLARNLTASGVPLPDVHAVCVSEQSLHLVLAAGQVPEVAAPLPWRADPETGQWRAPFGPVADRDLQRTLRRTQVPPYPALVTIGATSVQAPDRQSATEHWLLDLEGIKVLTLSGDPDRCRGLARFMIAELAHNIWSEELNVTVAGLESGLSEVNSWRIACTDDVGKAVARVHADLRMNQEALHGFRLADVLSGRAQDIAGDSWYPHILILHAGALASDPNRDRIVQQVRELASALNRFPGRLGLALVLVHDLPAGETPVDLGVSPAVRLHIEADGSMGAPSGASLAAAYLPEAAAAQLAGVLAAACQLDDQPAPPSRGLQPWDALMDATGAPRAELTLQAEDGDPSAGSNHPNRQRPLTLVKPAAGLSVLGVAPASRVGRSASTAQDLTVLAPQIGDGERRRIDDTDPGLDADLAAWHDPDSDRARLSLLGSLRVRASGSLPAERPREPWHTEVVAYLAAHPRGVSREQLGTHLWPDDPDITSKPKLRQCVSRVRRWLGTDPLTGQPYIPSADAALPGGLGAYLVRGLLTDAELFRRLRLRGVAGGPPGIDDLQAALDLVTGPPYDRRRPEGYAWLIDTPLDVEYTAMIVDVAHLVATYHLTTGHPDRAAAAARVALKAGSQDDTPLLDLVAACDAQGLQGEAKAWVQQILSTHDAELEEDLPPRTAEILHKRQWAHPGT
jgi:hypothetical protein